MKIAVYSGSFDPLHIGHLAIMECLTNEKEFDWVYLVISPQNPLKDPSKALSARQRYDDAVEAVKRHPKLHVWVDDIEMNMTPPHYTIRTLDALKKREPENEFRLVIGADNLENIHKWRDSARLLSEYGVVVYPRKGYNADSIRLQLQKESLHFPTPYVLDAYETHLMEGAMTIEETFERLYNIRVIDAPIIDISSTEIREAQEKGIDMSHFLM